MREAVLLGNGLRCGRRTLHRIQRSSVTDFWGRCIVTDGDVKLMSNCRGISLTAPSHELRLILGTLEGPTANPVGPFIACLHNGIRITTTSNHLSQHLSEGASLNADDDEDSKIAKPFFLVTALHDSERRSMAPSSCLA